MSRDETLRRLSLDELREALAELEPEELGLVLPADWITRGVLALSPEGRDSCLGEIVDAIEEVQEELPGLLQVRLFLANGLVGSLRRALAASKEDVRVLEGEVENLADELLEAQLGRQEDYARQAEELQALRDEVDRLQAAEVVS